MRTPQGWLRHFGNVTKTLPLFTWSRKDSNLRPADYESAALTCCATRPKVDFYRCRMIHKNRLRSSNLYLTPGRCPEGSLYTEPSKGSVIEESHLRPDSAYLYREEDSNLFAWSGAPCSPVTEPCISTQPTFALRYCGQATRYTTLYNACFSCSPLVRRLISLGRVPLRFAERYRRIRYLHPE